jgi:hypothetical protein
MRLCKICGKEYPETKEYWELRGNKPCRKECRFCFNDSRKQYREENNNSSNKRYRQENKEKISSSNKRYRQENKEKISSSKKRYRQENKEKISSSNKRYYQENKEKVISSNKRYRQENKEKVISLNERYRQENKEKISSSNKRYYQENKEKIVQQKVVYKRNLRKTNPAYKIRTNISRCINKALRKQSSTKDGSCLSKFPYTMIELRQHLEAQFQPGMSWENYGQWHIDHIIPQSKLLYTSMDDENFKKCWALENLQPLWAVDNLKKGSKIL